MNPQEASRPPSSDRDDDFTQRMARIEEQIQALEELADAEVRETARALVQSVLELHALGLARVLDHLRQAGDAGRAIRDSLGRDALVSSVLTLHGLHPVDLAARLQQVLEQLRPLLDVHGSSATIDRAEGGIVRVHLTGPSLTGRAPSFSVKQALEAAIFEAAPDVVRVEFTEPVPASTRISLPVVPAPGKVDNQMPVCSES